MANRSEYYDAVVVGAGPNGLAAAIVMAQAGKSVALFEANDTIGGGVRSAEITLPGFVHDLCSSVYPLAAGSPFFRTLPLAQHGLEWIEPPAALAHPFDDGSALVVERSLETTALGLALTQQAIPRCSNR
jgi:phytoene dehydrogenase-like protein